MLTYNGLYHDLKNSDLSNIDKPLETLVPGVEFLYKVGDNYRKCVITKTLNGAFAYEYVNQQLRNSRVNEMIITFPYWNRNNFTRNGKLHLKEA